MELFEIIRYINRFIVHRADGPVDADGGIFGGGGFGQLVCVEVVADEVDVVAGLAVNIFGESEFVYIALAESDVKGWL